MNIDVKTLMQGLNEYAPQANALVETLAKAVMPVALVILMTLLLFELTSSQSRIKNGDMSQKEMIEVAITYTTAFLIMMMATYAVDAILWVVDAGIGAIDGKLPATEFKYEFELGKIKGPSKWIMQILGGGVSFVADKTVTILVYMRFFTMYLLKAISPLMTAFFVSSQLRPIAINFLKLFAATAFQGILLLVVVRLFPVIVSDEIFKAATGDKNAYAVAFGSIIKGIVFIATLVQTNRMSKQLLNAA